MVVQILGLIDIITGISFLLNKVFSYIGWNFMDFFVKIFAGILLIKGGIFAIGWDFLSIIDVICAIIIFLSLFYTLPIQLVLVISFYLILKGISSLVVFRN